MRTLSGQAARSKTENAQDDSEVKKIGNHISTISLVAFMKASTRLVWFVVLAVIVALSCRGQQLVPAPTSLPNCIIKYELNEPDWVITHAVRTIFYESDGTYSEWVVSYSTVVTSGTGVLHSGTFTYAIDPQNPAHATIIYDGGIGTVTNDELYFYAPTGGTVGGPLPGPLAVLPIITRFTIFTAQASSGGINLSTRSTLAAGGTAITGFVVGGTSPRWVLLRAVGASLQQFGISSTVASPSFTLWDSKHNVVGTSSVWSADPNLVGGFNSASSMVGAFPLNAGSDEGVLLTSLSPGAYSFVLSGKSAGEIMAEVYFLPY